MENNSEREASARADLAHTMPDIDSVWSARTLNRPMMDGEDRARTLSQRDHLGPGLHPRALLSEYELSPGEILAWSR